MATGCLTRSALLVGPAFLWLAVGTPLWAVDALVTGDLLLTSPPYHLGALGVAVLGAFLVLERRREIAILRSLGADTRQILTGPVLEGSIAALGSLAIGVPIGIGLAILAVQILRLFFTLPPPLVTVPAGQLAGLALFMLGASVVALGAALVAIERSRLAAILKGQ